MVYLFASGPQISFLLILNKVISTNDGRFYYIIIKFEFAASTLVRKWIFAATFTTIPSRFLFWAQLHTTLIRTVITERLDLYIIFVHGLILTIPVFVFESVFIFIVVFPFSSSFA